MKLTQGVKFLASAMAVVALASLSSAASETARFLVECHSIVTAQGNIPKDYAYHLRAWGYPEEVANGINIKWDEKNVILSVDSRQPQEKEYSPLYPKLTLVMRGDQLCKDSKCQQVEYEPKDFEGKLVVTYDKDKGVILIKHAIAPETVIQGRGGCQFVALPPQN